MTSAARTEVIEADLLVLGGGTGGPMAAIKAKEKNPGLRVVLMEKANVKRSGAICMGMDGLNNAVIPGYATPEQYVKEITVANDGIVHQQAVMAYAQGSYPMIRFLDQLGVKFEKDGSGEFNVRKVHHMGTYVLPMPEGHHVKKILYRQLRRLQVAVTNRYMATRLLKAPDGRIAGAIGVNTRNGEFLVVRAKAVILACGAAGRLGLPASGYLFGTYENAANSGDGYAMAFHAGAELANLECFQINPLIKDYNGPACAYVTGPFGGYTANNRGQRFIECDYWSGQMMLEFWRELQSGSGPVFLKLDHLAPETIGEIETILHSNERPSRGRFHERRGTNYRHRHDRDAHLGDRLLLRSQRLGRVGERARGDDRPGSLRGRRHGQRSAQLYARRLRQWRHRRRRPRPTTAPRPICRRIDAADVAAEQERVMAPTLREDGLTPLRDGVQDPAPGQRLPAAAEGYARRSTSARNDSPKCARISTISSPAIRTS